jgi:hypothetical protein
MLLNSHSSRRWAKIVAFASDLNSDLLFYASTYSVIGCIAYALLDFYRGFTTNVSTSIYILASWLFVVDGLIYLFSWQGNNEAPGPIGLLADVFNILASFGFFVTSFLYLREDSANQEIVRMVLFIEAASNVLYFFSALCYLYSWYVTSEKTPCEGQNPECWANATNILASVVYLASSLATLLYHFSLKQSKQRGNVPAWPSGNNSTISFFGDGNPFVPPDPLGPSEGRNWDLVVMSQELRFMSKLSVFGDTLYLISAIFFWVTWYRDTKESYNECVTQEANALRLAEETALKAARLKALHQRRPSDAHHHRHHPAGEISLPFTHAPRARSSSKESVASKATNISSATTGSKAQKKKNKAKEPSAIVKELSSVLSVTAREVLLLERGTSSASNGSEAEGTRKEDLAKSQLLPPFHHGGHIHAPLLPPVSRSSSRAAVRGGDSAMIDVPPPGLLQLPASSTSVPASREGSRSAMVVGIGHDEVGHDHFSKLQRRSAIIARGRSRFIEIFFTTTATAAAAAAGDIAAAAGTAAGAGIASSSGPSRQGSGVGPRIIGTNSKGPSRAASMRKEGGAPLLAAGESGLETEMSPISPVPSATFKPLALAAGPHADHHTTTGRPITNMHPLLRRISSEQENYAESEVQSPRVSDGYLGYSLDLDDVSQGYQIFGLLYPLLSGYVMCPRGVASFLRCLMPCWCSRRRPRGSSGQAASNDADKRSALVGVDDEDEGTCGLVRVPLCCCRRGLPCWRKFLWLQQQQQQPSHAWEIDVRGQQQPS